MDNSISKGIAEFKKVIPNPKQGLGTELFEYISTLTPIVNVDLFICQESKGILLAWREDSFGKGWHIPGGIVRFKETFADRIQKTALEEIGTKVNFDKNPLSINEIILSQAVRGHFISFLYRCYLPEDFFVIVKKDGNVKPGELKWFLECPPDCLEVHRNIYSGLFQELKDPHFKEEYK